MAENLTPLTPAQQAEFERSRISRNVVQHKCAGCGAWYETTRASADFHQSFFCDCGGWLSFTVPAIELVKKPTESEILAARSGDVLDTGMTVDEALRLAAHWWNTKGARLMQTEAKRQAQPIGVDKGNGGKFASLNPDDPNFLPSGIINGEPWDTLNKREKIQVVKAWHHFAIRNPQQI